MAAALLLLLSTEITETNRRVTVTHSGPRLELCRAKQKNPISNYCSISDDRKRAHVGIRLASPSAGGMQEHLPAWMLPADCCQHHSRWPLAVALIQPAEL